MSGYDERYFTSTYGAAGLPRFGAHWWAVRWYAEMAARCLRANGGRRVLELGCGQGFMLARLEDRYETWGLDVAPYAVEQAARFAPRSRCAVADVEAGLPPEVAAGGFDLVVAKYVLEHLADPAAALVRIAGLLRPGGTLLYAVPYTGSLGARLKVERWYAHPRIDPTHRSLLAREEWLALTRAAGFEIERESADGWWDVPYVDWLPAKLQLALVIAPTALACLSGRAILPPRWGENVLVIARKPSAPGSEQLQPRPPGGLPTQDRKVGRHPPGE